MTPVQTHRRGPDRPIRLLIVDDHPVVRAGMIAMLADEPDLEVVADVGDGAAAVALVGETPIDVVLMDLRMPGVDGVTATRLVRALPGAPEVIILTTYDTDAEIIHAVEAGARGYLLKDTEPAVLSEAIRRAARGETVLAPPVAAKLAAQLRSPRRPELTPREVEVVHLVARGLSNPEIARALSIGEATVKTHLLRIFTKLGVADRTAAVTTAYSLGLIDLLDA